MGRIDHFWRRHASQDIVWWNSARTCSADAQRMRPLCASVNGHREVCWLSCVDELVSTSHTAGAEWVLTGYSATLKRVERIEVGAGLGHALQVDQ